MPKLCLHTLNRQTIIISLRERISIFISLKIYYAGNFQRNTKKQKQMTIEKASLLVNLPSLTLSVMTS